jgi:hypothetical protein
MDEETDLKYRIKQLEELKNVALSENYQSLQKHLRACLKIRFDSTIGISTSLIFISAQTRPLDTFI